VTLHWLEVKAIDIYAAVGTPQPNLGDFNAQYEALEVKLDDICLLLSKNNKTNIYFKNLTRLNEAVYNYR
jgi:hypothetical protein